MATLTCEQRRGSVSWQSWHFCRASHARAQHAHLQGAGHLLRAAAAAGARNAGARAEEGGAARGSRSGAREGRVGGEERGVPETRQCGYRATPRYHAKTSNHPSPPHRRAVCRRRCRRAGALMQR